MTEFAIRNLGTYNRLERVGSGEESSVRLNHFCRLLFDMLTSNHTGQTFEESEAFWD